MAIKLTEREVFTTRPETHKVRRKGSYMYFTRSLILPDETKEKFEEVANEDIPRYDEEEDEL